MAQMHVGSAMNRTLSRVRQRQVTAGGLDKQRIRVAEVEVRALLPYVAFVHDRTFVAHPLRRRDGIERGLTRPLRGLTRPLRGFTRHRRGFTRLPPDFTYAMPEFRGPICGSRDEAGGLAGRNRGIRPARAGVSHRTDQSYRREKRAFPGFGVNPGEDSRVWLWLLSEMDIGAGLAAQCLKGGKTGRRASLCMRRPATVRRMPIATQMMPPV